MYIFFFLFADKSLRVIVGHLQHHQKQALVGWEGFEELTLDQVSSAIEDLPEKYKEQDNKVIKFFNLFTTFILLNVNVKYIN
jgi:hypothetical protein